jgi:hypothetical protein
MHLFTLPLGKFKAFFAHKQRHILRASTRFTNIIHELFRNWNVAIVSPQFHLDLTTQVSYYFGPDSHKFGMEVVISHFGHVYGCSNLPNLSLLS